MSKENTDALAYSLINVESGAAVSPLLGAEDAPNPTTWKANCFYDEDSDDLVWSFLNRGHSFKKMPSVVCEIEGIENIFVVRNHATRIPTGLVIENVKASGISQVALTIHMNYKLDGTVEKPVWESRMRVLVDVTIGEETARMYFDDRWKEEPSAGDIEDRHASAYANVFSSRNQNSGTTCIPA